MTDKGKTRPLWPSADAVPVVARGMPRSARTGLLLDDPEHKFEDKAPEIFNYVYRELGK